MTNSFRPGQRWISTSEPELGLGEVRAVGPRTVRVVFAATGDTRDYALTSAPLRRVAFRAGDSIRTVDQQDAVVRAVREQDGMLTYATDLGDVRETALAHTLSFASPTERLFAGAFDPPALFDLRLAALHHEHRRRQSPVRGFLGGRIDLLPHQIGIAADVADRLLPRVLLADEVGLGKTIEACLILHRLLQTGRAQRALIVVQESLIHQWFLELLRRFNLWFHIYTEGRCQAVEEQTPDANPFLEQQLILCDTTLFTGEAVRLQQAVAAGWDLLVVDEAHHLTWTPASASPEYRAIETLGRRVPGLLLLTATPEQLGVAGHFARLRLLDPHRFHDLDAFVREADGYRAVARIAERLDAGTPLAPADAAQLAAWLAMDDATVADALADPAPAARRPLIDRLVDQHGPGRVIFRNTRATVSGFPKRTAHLHPLTIEVDDTARRKALAQEWQADASGSDDGGRLSYERDPRLRWLVAFLRDIAPAKVLLICRTMARAVAIEAALKQQSQLKAAAFHEGMTLIQRDRAAAWFADPAGARLLICSEIGSEGRNFQFAHQLVLFDLPIDPGVLEQRIGRLDRIGQRHAIGVHVPFVPSTPQEVLVRWYHDGLDALASNVPGARELMARFGERLRALAGTVASATSPAAVRGAGDTTATPIDALVADTQGARAEVSRRLEEGRDRLLEWSSHRPATARPIVDAIAAEDRQPSLDQFLLAVLDLYMIEVEELSPRTYRIGSAGVLVDDFPGLSADRVTVTSDRARALEREDFQFLTWDHPLATGALDLLFGSEHGNCSVARWIDDVQELYLETVWVLECVAPAHLGADRFLPPTPLRTIVDRRGVDVSGTLTPAQLTSVLVKAEGGRGLLANPRVRDELLPRLLDRNRQLADAQTPAVIAEAQRAARARIGREADRLVDLRRRNPSVRQEEIDALRDQQQQLEAQLGAARLRLDGVRLIHRGPGRTGPASGA